MGLITETVEITWQRATCTHFKNLGYAFTKIGDVFKVNVEDLFNTSIALVHVKCDGEHCENPYMRPISWANYKMCVKEDGKYYCRKCSKKLTGLKKQMITLLLKSKSFKQWCIENGRLDILDRWDYELNKYKPEEICYSSRKKFYFKCPRDIHESELCNIGDFTNGHKGVMNCRKCNSFAQWGIDNICKDFLEKYWDYIRNIISPWKISYGSRSKNIWLICQEKDYHESYISNCNNFINENRCPYCTNQHGKVHPLDSLGTLHSESLNIWSDKNKKSPYEYSPYADREVWWKCPEGKHKDYKRNIANSTRCKFRCPECVEELDESILQNKIRLYLKGLDFELKHESKCTLKCYNPKTHYLLPYDNEITINDKHIIFECNGIQHYEITNFAIMAAKKNNTTPDYELHYQKLKDRYKRIFAKSQGYFYVEIPYWADDKDETWKKLIDDKILNVKRKRSELI